MLTQKEISYASRISRKGFTLIELLVVIAIISLLVSILLPSLSNAKKLAASAVCKSNLRNIGTLFGMYTNDYDGMFQPGWHSGLQNGGWLVALRSYYGETPEILYCPMATEMWTGETAGTFLAWSASYTHFPKPPVPADFDVAHTKGSYGVNWLVSNPPATTPIVSGFSRDDFWRTSSTDVASPADVPLVLDSLFWLGRPNDIDEAPAFDGEVSFSSGGEMRRFCINRHMGSINGVFIDSSVRGIPLKSLWTLKWHRNFDTSLPAPDWPDWMSGL